MLMLMLKRVAVTGGMASGKSAACRIFKELGAYVVSADDIVHRLLTPNTSVGKSVITLFGGSIVVDDKIDRSKIAKIVFDHPTLLLSLQSLIHPAVLDEVEREYQKARQQPHSTLFVVEIPLLFEMGAEKRFDYSVCVTCDYNTCIQRYTLATGGTKEEFDKRMSHQMSPVEKAKRATWTVNNDGTLDGMVESIHRIYYSLVPNNNPHTA
jgi:dephospho-CoA kinase